ncbi:hypothetical protein ACVXHB_10315 [Escherichia coli]
MMNKPRVCRRTGDFMEDVPDIPFATAGHAWTLTKQARQRRSRTANSPCSSSWRRCCHRRGPR